MSVKKFTREKPCTKAEIWNCFVDEDGFVAVPVAMAREEIGVNVPRIMEREGRLYIEEIEDSRSGEYYILTEEGEEWLMAGTRAFHRNHPSVKLTSKHMLEEDYDG